MMFGRFSFSEKEKKKDAYSAGLSMKPVLIAIISSRQWNVPKKILV
jgi:hypothetical protein